MRSDHHHKKPNKISPDHLTPSTDADTLTTMNTPHHTTAKLIANLTEAMDRLIAHLETLEYDEQHDANLDLAYPFTLDIEDTRNAIAQWHDTYLATL